MTLSVAWVTLPSPLIGKPAPAFTLTDVLDPSRSVSNAALKGQVYVLNVWGTWCGECRAEHEELRRSLDLLQELTRTLTSLPCPSVAAVQGYAVGGGAEIALTADFVVAAPDLRLRFPEVPLGHAPTGGITLRLPLR